MMKLFAEHAGRKISLEDDYVDLSIPLIFNGTQPNTYGVPKAESQPYEGGGFIGDTREGGPCNFETFRLTPHCNGTHTECVGHISLERIDILSTLKDVFIPASLITIRPEEVVNVEDSYQPNPEPGDRIISERLLSVAIEKCDPKWLKGLIIRTLPNSEDKKSRDYMKKSPPFFSHEAMHALRDAGVEHLLVDFPSVDRLFDEGRLSAHHIFWSVPQGSKQVDPGEASAKTITEFIFVPDSVKDGSGLLNIQIAPFVSDAAPSRPLFFPLTNNAE